MMVAGTISFAGFATSPLYELCALFFGIGIGLTIDEFALWVHLDDVYWAEDGRRSIDATVIAASALGLVLLGHPALRDRRRLRRRGDPQHRAPAGALRDGRLLLLQAPDAARADRLPRPAAGPLRRLPDRQARLTVGAALLRRTPPEEAGEGRAPLPPRAPDRPHQGGGAHGDRRLHGSGLRGQTRGAQATRRRRWIASPFSGLPSSGLD